MTRSADTDAESKPSPAPARWPYWRLVRRVSLGVGVLILTLVAVLIIRTLSFHSVQPQVKPVPLVKVDRAAALKRLGDAIRLRTISHEDSQKTDFQPFTALQQQLATAFPRVHRQLKREIVNQHGLLYTWAGSDPKLRPVLLLAHVDVVPVEAATRGRWTHPPFGGEVHDGYLWGRGTMDDKGQAMAILEALEHLLATGFQPKRTVLLAIGHDEEVGGALGATHIARLLERRGVKTYFTLDEGLVITRGIIPGVKKPVAVVGIAEKGYVTLEITVRGEGGHSSMPPAETAVGLLGRALDRLEGSPMPAPLSGPILRTFEAVGPEMPFGQRLVFANLWLFGSIVKKKLTANPATNAVLRTTFAPTMLQGSPQENVLAKQARALVNVRLHPRDNVAAAIRHARRVIADDRVHIRARPASISEPLPSSQVDSAGYRLIARTIRQVCPDVIVAPGLMVGLTDSRHYRKVSPQTFRFLPLRIQAKDRARFHGVNERVGVNNYFEIITFYAQLIRNAS